jgi:hypothetical protein
VVAGVDGAGDEGGGFGVGAGDGEEIGAWKGDDVSCGEVRRGYWRLAYP